MAPLFLAILCLASRLSAAAECGVNTSLAGYEADLRMSQNQLRGRVTVLDGCSFRVAALDLLPGSVSAWWWPAEGTDLDFLTRGEPASSDPLNRTFWSESLVLRLLSGLSWPLVPVLAAFDPLTSSLFGFVHLSGNNSSAATAPTMLNSCAQLSPRIRVRWTLDEASNSIDIGLEAAVGSEYYMAFGWAKPGATEPSMIGADVALAGFTEDSLPFAEDYYVTKNSECMLREDGLVEGVCPDTFYDRDGAARLVNNTRLVYGHRRDGVSLVLFSRPLVSVIKKYDVPMNATMNMTVIWSIGMLRPPDSLQPYYLPLSRAPSGTAFGFLTLVRTLPG